MNIIKIIRSKLKEVALQTYFFISGLTLFNLGIFSISFNFGLITTGITLVMLAVIINIEKER